MAALLAGCAIEAPPGLEDEGASASRAALQQVVGDVVPQGLSTPDFCAQDFYSPTEKTVTVPVDHSNPGAGTIDLWVRVYRPHTACDEYTGADLPSEVPTILVNSPYFNGFFSNADPSGPEATFRDRGKDLVDRYNPRGYAVALADLRGTGNSQGCFEFDGPNQAADYRALVEWVVAQPWSTDRVAGYGRSFDAEVMHAGVALAAPVPLTTMISIAGVSGAYDVYAFDGVPYATRATEDAALYLARSHDPPQDRDLFEGIYRQGCNEDALEASVDLSGDLAGWYLEREFRQGVHNVTASTLHIQGLADTAVYPVNIAGWYDELPGFKRAV